MSLMNWHPSHTMKCREEIQPEDKANRHDRQDNQCQWGALNPHCLAYGATFTG
jgi:hypothetical protein